MSIYKQLNDPEWLHQKYEVENLSTLQISKLVGCKTPNSTRQALIKFGVPLRSRRDAQIIGRDDNLVIDEEVLTGTLLGDGSLQKSSKTSLIAAPYYTKKCKWEDYSHHVGRCFSKSGDPRLTFEQVFLKRKRWNANCEYYVFRTLSSLLLTSWYSKWYPSGKKIVPTDLVLTPRTVLYWFLDDGYSCYRHREKEVCRSRGNKAYPQRTKQVILGFCSESFTKQENDLLCKKLEGLGIGASVRKCNSGSGWRIFIDQSAANDFFDLIGECPVDSLKYKWKQC
jgi:hypothetical protein